MITRMSQGSVICIALLCAPAMAQAPFIPAQAMTDWDYMQGQWTNTETPLAWNLYDVLTENDDFIGLEDMRNGADPGDVYASDPVYGENWAASDSFDIGTGRNDYLEGNMDLDGGGIPDEYDFALMASKKIMWGLTDSVFMFKMRKSIKCLNEDGKTN